MVLKIVVDTCVWLDLAKDHQNQPVLGALEDLIKDREIELLIPRVVLEEFERSKDRVIEETRRSFQSHFKVVREAVNQFAEDQHKVETLSALNDVDRKIGIKGDAISGSMSILKGY